MSGNVTQLVPDYLIHDLAGSGLTPTDIRARIAGPNEKQATNTPMGVDAYVIPYDDMYGKPLPFYRAKLINNPDPKIKYKQVATSSNHVYFPPGFNSLMRGAKYLMITEGEKKAAAAVKAGFLCCALGGVHSWRNRTVVLHKDAQVGTASGGQLVARLPAGAEASERIDSLATGLVELIDWAIRKKIPIVICFDSDLQFKGLVRFEVQRAAAMLGYELRNRGVPFNMIRQLILSPVTGASFSGTEKLGLDDFLVHEDLGKEYLDEQLDVVLRAKSAFPRHPNPKEFINRRLQKTQITRNETQAIATAIICELDANGQRLHCADDDTLYYFDEGTYKLIRVNISQQMDMAKTPFGKKMYSEFGLSSIDYKVLAVINAQFCAEQPIQDVKPEKIMTIRGDTLYYQISDGLMLKVTAKGIQVLTNGSDDVLFAGDMVKPIPHKQLQDVIKFYQAQETLTCMWYPVLQSARIRESEEDRSRKILALLYSISPWFYRWHGTQLPLEQMLGEAGSGKSTLYSLRQQIISGISSLRNAPRDLRDWTASVASCGALHVTDNVHMTDSGLKQQLSDELCRVITAHDPHIESRKLYTDNDLVRVPVKSVFAVTAIKQPFTNTDIIQRSIITQLDKGNEEIVYEDDWESAQLKLHGGRIHWIAQQMVFMQRMFQRLERDWEVGYKAKFRLINVEQLLCMAARVYGWDHHWVPGFLEQERDERTVKADAAIEGLKLWADEVRAKIPERKLVGTYFTAQDMVHFFEAQEEWDKHPILTNGRKLGHYLEEKKNVIATLTGIINTGMKRFNRNAYKVGPADSTLIT